MKKFYVSVIYLLLISLVFAESVDFIQSGEYAIYLDTRGNSNFLRGYWLAHTENNKYVVISRNKNLNTNTEVNIFIEFSDDADGMPHIDKIKGATNSTAPEYRQGLLDFLNYVTLYINHESEIGNNTIIEDPWDSYTLEFSYNKLLPFFRFLSIKEKGSDKPSYVLNCSGITNGTNIDAFLNRGIQKIDENKRSLKGARIPDAKAISVTLNGLKTELDENWKYNDSLGSPGYWLSFYSYRDSQITVEKASNEFYKEKGIDNTELCRLSIITLKNVDYSSIYAIQESDKFKVGYTLYDDNYVKNYQVFIVKDITDYHLIINFSTFADIFDVNTDYYKSIIKKLENTH